MIVRLIEGRYKKDRELKISAGKVGSTEEVTNTFLHKYYL